MKVVFNAYLSSQTPSPEQSPVTCVGWNRLSGLLACGHKNGFITIASIEEDSEHPGHSHIIIKATIPEHHCEITSLVWNERYDRLITTDISGLLLMWSEREGKWTQIKPGERTGFKISSITCSHNGEYVALGYDNGFVVCGTSEVELRWTSELSHAITSIAWISETKKMYAGTSESALYAISDQGNTIKIIDLSEYLSENSSIISVGANNVPPDVVLIAFSNGEIVLMNSVNDEVKKVIPTEMTLTSAVWSRDGSIFAVAGRPYEENFYRILFYSVEGILLRSLNLSTLNISAIYFDISGTRLLAGVGNLIGIIQIVRIYPYHYFKNTLVYSFPCSIPNLFNIVFFNSKNSGKHVKEIHHLLGIAGTTKNVVIASLVNEKETALVICNEFGVPIKESFCNFAASLFSVSDTFIAASSSQNLFLWNYQTNETKGFNFSKHITALSMKSKFLFVSFQSNELISYAIPSFEEHSHYKIPFIVDTVHISSDETRISMIDVYGNMVFLDIHSGTATKSTRNETWCAMWAEDSPNYLVSLEKQRLYVYNNFVPEESIIFLTHICKFKGLVVNTIDFINLFSNDPLNPSIKIFHNFDSKPLRDLKNLIKSDAPRDEIISYVSDKDHLTLWRILAEFCLGSLDLYNAEKAFSRTHNRASILFMKSALNFPKNSDIQNGIIAWYLQDYSKAESLLMKANRVDLVLEMLNSICDWPKILEIADESEKEIRTHAHSMIAREEERKENWEIAADHYKEAGDIEKCVLSLFNCRQFEKICQIVEKSNDQEILKKIGNEFTLRGDIDHAIDAFLKAGDFNGAVESCISLDEWKKALELSEQHNEIDKRKLISRYAKYLTNNSQISMALHLLIKNNLSIEAAQMLSNEGNNALSQQNYVFAKKCYLFAALQSMKSPNNEIETKKLWHQCEAIHFLLIANKAILKFHWVESIELVSRLFSDYSDVVGKERSAAFLTIVGIYSTFYKQCSLGFIHLENSKNFSKKKKEQFEKMAIKIFSKVNPVDPPACKEFKCSNCNRKMVYPQVKCRCGFVTTPSIVSGNSIKEDDSWQCKNCLHYAAFDEIEKFKLKTDNVLQLPFQTYDDFLFIVNGQKFKTNRIVADLLSPQIRQQHFIDPTVSEFTINTKHAGDFSLFLNLINFSKYEIPSNEISFVVEILEKLCQNEQGISLQIEQPELSNNNVISLLKSHENYQNIFSQNFRDEVDFLSLHFYEFIDNDEEIKLNELLPDTIELIISNPKLKLNNEDQLLTFVNKLYLNDSNYRNLYNYVHFCNVEQNTIIEFLKIFDINDISNESWQLLSIRLSLKVNNDDELKKNSKRYNEIKLNENDSNIFKFESDEKFNGIINHFRSKSNENKINITASSINSNDEAPINSILFENKDNYFASKDEKNSWICYEFKDNFVIPTDYTIRSPSFAINSQHPRSWVIEGSINSNDWIILDEQKDCSFMNGPSYVHTFHISKSNKIKFIRIRETDKNWWLNSISNSNYNLAISAFEIYGTLI